MIHSFKIGIRSQSVTPDFKNLNMGQIGKASNLLLPLVQTIDNRASKF